jgi:hypothetical protein
MRGENHEALVYMPVLFHESLPLPASAECTGPCLCNGHL